MASERTIVAVIGGQQAEAVVGWTAVEAYPRDRIRILYAEPTSSYTMMDWQDAG